jgi:hypothetical protein
MPLRRTARFEPPAAWTSGSCRSGTGTLYASALSTSLELGLRREARNSRSALRFLEEARQRLGSAGERLGTHGVP